jgi:hypothetical protein
MRRTSLCETLRLILSKYRLYWSFETKSLPRRYCEMRGAVQQEQNGTFHSATRRREDKHSHRAAVWEYWLAFEQEIWTCCWCVQAFNNVGFTTVTLQCFRSNHRVEIMMFGRMSIFQMMSSPRSWSPILESVLHLNRQRFELMLKSLALDMRASTLWRLP